MRRRHVVLIFLCASLGIALIVRWQSYLEDKAPYQLPSESFTPNRPYDPRRSPPAPQGTAALGDPGASEIRFVNIAASAGLNYKWTIDGPRPLDILQTIGTGCAFLDYDNDGNLDILLVGSKLALFKGDGHGHFTNVTHEVGLDTLTGHFLGCTVGDYDNDGFDDIYISGYRTGVLLHNEGGRHFRDVTKAAGIKPQPWGTSCAFGDIDNDGKLDLYIGNYVDFDPRSSKRLCPYLGHMAGCGPIEYTPLKGVLYKNLGSGKFKDVTSAYKLNKVAGKTLGVGFADYDGSGRQSLYTANDEIEGNLFHNNGKTFEEVGVVSGTAYGAPGNVHAGMGMDWGDYDNDGNLDLVVATYALERKTVYRNLGTGLFQEVSDSLALTQYAQVPLAFGVKWIDFDNDGWLDLVFSNGHVQDMVEATGNSQHYRQATRLFRNDHGHLMVDMNERAGSDIQQPIVGRGLAIGDIDNDGREDILVVDSEGSPLLLHNESKKVGHWLLFKLIGTQSNRDGIGARIIVNAGPLSLTRLCHSDGSYLSSSDLRVHVGLGTTAKASSITIHWPSGITDILHNIKTDQIITIREGQTIH